MARKKTLLDIPYESPKMDAMTAALMSIPAKRKVYSWPLTQDILMAHQAAGFTEVMLRNPITGEEAVLLPPELKGGICGTCGQKLSEPHGPPFPK